MIYLSKDDVLAILSEAYKHSKRNHLMILAGWVHGARASELCELKSNDISNGWITIHRKKGSDTTCQPLKRSDNPLLDESGLLDLVPDENGRLFPITRIRFWQLMKYYGKKAGLPAIKCRPHALKHACGMLVFQATHLPAAVSSYLGHKWESSSLQYLKADAGRKALEAIEAL